MSDAAQQISPEPPRRDLFRKAAAILIGSLAGIIPAAAGLAVLLDPLRRKSGAARFIRVTTLDALPTDGSPRKFSVLADRSDAWSKSPNTPIGAVYLLRRGDKVTAFNVRCPHAGCFVDAVAGDGFHCPCHNSQFTADGALVPGSVSPRGLDELEVDPQSLKTGVVQVKFENFIAGSPEKAAPHMIKPLLDWLDDRTGCRGMLHATLYEHIPGGARWRYVWGSTLVFAFSVQMITGFFLWMGYSPSSQTAWESVYYIQFEMTGGWLLRGIHHFMAQAMIVLLVFHMAQIIIDGAYRAPREVNFWIGLVLLLLTLGLSLTGYLLPWDQKGYWATQVATNIMGIAPGIGQSVQRIVIGGSDYGNLTLTRFFAVHAGLLPFLIIIFTIIHLYLFRRHGIKHKEPTIGPDSTFWVDQVLKDAIACMAILCVVIFLICWPWMKSMGHELPGAELGAPADPSAPYSAARPEWYFLFLFQFLKLHWFAGPNELYGAIVIPSAVMLVFALMPLLGRWKIGHFFNIIFFIALIIGVIILTSMALLEDRTKTEYTTAVKQADFEAHRAVELAQAATGIPAAGAVTLIRSDPLIQGPRLFSQNCASCHRYDGTDGMGQIPKPDINPQTASDLKGFGSREWLTGLLDPARIATANYFGANKHKDGKMVKFVTEDLGKADDAKKSQIKSVIAALSAEAQLKSQKAQDAADADMIKQGQAALKDQLGCLDCHTYKDNAGSENTPDLTGYGSRQWLIDFIRDPSHERFYGQDNDRMPAFGGKQLLDDQQIGLITDWLRGDWYTPRG